MHSVPNLPLTLRQPGRQLVDTLDRPVCTVHATDDLPMEAARLLRAPIQPGDADRLAEAIAHAVNHFDRVVLCLVQLADVANGIQQRQALGLSVTDAQWSAFARYSRLAASVVGHAHMASFRALAASMADDSGGG